MFGGRHINMSTITLLVLLTVLVAWILGGFQRQVIFPASKQIAMTPEDYAWEYEDVVLSVGQHKTTGWYLPVKNPRGAVLFSHGNAGNISHRLDSIKVFRDMGFDVMIYDYGGYGKSTGKSSEKRCYADIRGVWRYLTEDRAIAPENIVLFGRSLGGGVVAELAAEVTPGAIIMESSFTSAVDVGREVFPFLPVKLILRHKFNAGEKMGSFSAPILIIHSPDDDIIPYHHGKELYELAPEPKAFLEIEGDHNGGWLDSGRKYTDGLRKFLETIFPEK